MAAEEEVVITEKFIKGLKKSYDEAVKSGAKYFTHNGHEFYTDYAMYFIEFYSSKFKIK